MPTDWPADCELVLTLQVRTAALTLYGFSMYRHLDDATCAVAANDDNEDPTVATRATRHANGAAVLARMISIHTYVYTYKVYIFIYI